MSELNVSICDSKYTVIQEPTGGTRVLRYGEEWRDVTGDNVICGLAWELQEARERIKRLEESRTKSVCNNLTNMISYEGAINKIKQLEKAGDDLAKIVERDYATKGFTEPWREAKEAKP